METGVPTGVADNPNSGSSYWFDGSLGGYDGIGQQVATTIGQSYTVGFYLADDQFYQDVYSGLPGAEGNYDPGSRDAYVYAMAGLPRASSPRAGR